jgi:hypothetical protein
MTTCKDDVDYICADCVDAWELSRNYSCNESPNPVSTMDEVKVGNCVEANQGEERFWMKVLAVCTCYLIGEVTTDQVFPHPFQKGDTLRIEIYQIYNVDRTSPGCIATE